MSHFTSLTEHQQLTFWVDMVVVLAVARGLGTLLRRWGQPAVVGELAAGVLLGPSVLGKAWPGGFSWLFPTDRVQSGALAAVGWVGIAFLLVLTGFETDLAIVRRLGRAAGSVAAGALAVPFAAGIGVGVALPRVFVGAHAHRAAFVLFVGVGLSISSLPVIAKILSDLGFMRRNFGQVTVAVGMVNDLVGWLALGTIAGLAESGSFSGGRLARTLVAMAVLVVGGLTLGQRGVDRVLRRVRTRSPGAFDSMVATVVVTLAVAAAAQAAGIEAVLGAYVAGIVLGRSRFLHPDVKDHLESLTMSVLAPIFFATAGLQLDLASLAQGSTAAWCGLILVAAVAAKSAGAYLGARAGRLHRRESVALGVALNARGAVEVVIATVGLSLGVLSNAAFTAIVVMAIVTSMMAPPLLRAVANDWRGTEEEQQRLEQEELLDKNLLVRNGRLLLPSRGRPNSIVAAQMLHFAWPPEVGVTVLSVGEDGAEPDLEPIRNVFEDRDVEFRRAADTATLEAILTESRLGYQAIGVGAADRRGERLLSPVVDELMAESPVPLVIVRRAPGQETATPAAFARAIVPVTGSPSSRTAQELAFSLSRTLGTEVVLTHVVNRPEPVPAGAGRQVDLDRPGGPGPSRREDSGQMAATAVLDQAVTLAEDFDVEAETVTRTGMSTGEEILAAAEEAGADLIVLGATVRRLDGRAFLGHNVEHVLDAAPTTVVVVTTPDVVPPAEGAGDRVTAAD